SDPEFQQHVQAIVEDLRAQPEVIDGSKTLSYLDLPSGGGLVSADGRSALISTVLHGELSHAEEPLALLHEVLAKHNRDGFTVMSGGIASVNQAFTEAAEQDL